MINFPKWIIIVFSHFLASNVIAQKIITPLPAPKAIKTAIVKEIHDTTLTDNYAWLRDKENPAVMPYLEEENDYTERVMAPQKALRKTIYDEIRGRIKETDLTVPFLMNGYYYYRKTIVGKDYPYYCRKKDSVNNKEEILLDINQLAKDHAYFDVYDFKVSPDNQWMAYFVDTIGNYETHIRFKNLISGETLSEGVEKVESFAWAADSQHFFYSIQDEVTNRSYKVFRHKINTLDKAPKELFHEKDERFDVYVSLSKSGEYVFMGTSSDESREVYFLNAKKPKRQFQLIHPRETNHRYYVYQHGKQLYIRTNKDAVNFKLITTDIKRPAQKYWKDFIPHREDVELQGLTIFRNYLVVLENKAALRQVRIISWKDKSEHYLKLKDDIYYLRLTGNMEVETDFLRFNYESMKTPSAIYDYHMYTKAKHLKKQQEILGGYEEKKYETKRIWAEARDGTKVPISLMYRKDLIKEEGNPVFLTAYGAYGYSSYTYFSLPRISLVDRGFIIATAHVRGGSDLGQEWYLQGKLLHKKNTFYDFIDCANHLVEEGYTQEGMITAYGASAGGLLMGAIANMRPELFKTIVLDVPFVDMMNTMMDSSIPLTTQEYEQWGNPNEKAFFDYMLSYSPYDNIKAQDYPNMLFLTGVNDEQVGYWEAAKMVAKLRAYKTDNNLLLLNTEMEAGHGGVSGLYGWIDEVALTYAFILKTYEQ